MIVVVKIFIVKIVLNQKAYLLKFLVPFGRLYPSNLIQSLTIYFRFQV